MAAWGAGLKSGAGRAGFLVFLALLLGGAVLASLSVGALKLSPMEILSTLWNRPGGVNDQILFNIRLPRILLGALVGGCFAVSGAILQGVMRNPLASPGIIGVSAGGGLAGILVLLAFPQFGFLLVPAAFCGEDIAGSELEQAMGAIGEIDGRAVGEDVVNRIFHNFCVGK